ncbi:MAG: methionine synthase [Lentisphaerae bacterium]|nr:methionine synthase [Lentisphaerota bacterium]
MKKIIELLEKKSVLVSDGAWGTLLQSKGLKPGECPELWNLDRPDDVFGVAKGYIDAGADMTQTNSFGANRFKLEFFGLGDQLEAINVAAAQLSRKAAGPDKHVLGSIGPTGKLLLMGDVSEEELFDAFKEQAIALEKGGASVACIETMSDVDEACLAIKAVKQNTDLEIISTFTFEKTLNAGYKTMMGIGPTDVVVPCMEAGADIIGVNCGNGFERMIEIVAEMREVTSLPILVHANAGMPENINGVDVFPDTPEMMADNVASLVHAGANIIGGCCGTTPAHIRAIKNAVESLKQ